MEAGKTANFILIGLSHKTAPIAVRERYAFTPDLIPPFLRSLIDDPSAGITETVLLSTCNRTELYLVSGGDTSETADHVLDAMTAVSSGADDDRTYFYTMSGITVVEHLYKVVSGIDSMILGEPQIFGQVKSAYALACDYDSTGPLTNRLFHHAFQVGKRVRNATSIGEGIVSISSAAVALAEQTLGSLDGKATLLVGAGKIGEMCAKQLIGCGIDDFYLMNRTRERADELTCRLSGTPVEYERLADMLAETDIIITSVASHDPVISARAAADAAAHRDGCPLVLIDLGVPRNIEPEAGELSGIHLFNIDDLEDVILSTRDRRQGEAEKALQIIERDVADYESWLKERETVPVIHDLRKKCENIRLAELDRIKNRIDSETFQTIDLVTRRIVRKILHNPTVTVRASESNEMRKQLIDSIHELFIKETGN